MLVYSGWPATRTARLRARRSHRAHRTVPGQGDQPPAADDDPAACSTSGPRPSPSSRRRWAPEEHGRPPRQGADRGRARPGRADAQGPGDRGALLRPDRADVLRGRRAQRRGRGDASRLQRLRGRRAGVGDGVPRREAVGLHPARAHLGGAGVAVLGADGRARRRVRPAAAVGARRCTASPSASTRPITRRCHERRTPAGIEPLRFVSRECRHVAGPLVPGSGGRPVRSAAAPSAVASFSGAPRPGSRARRPGAASASRSRSRRRRRAAARAARAARRRRRRPGTRSPRARRGRGARGSCRASGRRRARARRVPVRRAETGQRRHEVDAAGRVDGAGERLALRGSRPGRARRAATAPPRPRRRPPPRARTPARRRAAAVTSSPSGAGGRSPPAWTSTKLPVP